MLSHRASRAVAVQGCRLLGTLASGAAPSVDALWLMQVLMGVAQGPPSCR